MPELRAPETRWRESFVAAMAEFRAEGRGYSDDSSVIGRDLRAADWGTDATFARYVAAVNAEALGGTPRPAHLVPSTTWWWVDGDEWLGRIALRHRLTPALLEVGGHIGYDVRASARRRGHAGAMLRAVLPRAAELGIDEALLTCDVDNVASRRVIESTGGRLEDERAGKLRFWLPTRT